MEPHMSPESQQLDDHLNGEHHSEDHVQDVHDGREQLRLLVMLGEKQQGHTASPCSTEAVSHFWILQLLLCGALPEQPE